MSCSCGGPNTAGFAPSNAVAFTILRGQAHTLHFDMGDMGLEGVTEVLFTAKTRPDSVDGDLSAIMVATGTVEDAEDGGQFIEVVLPVSQTIKTVPGSTLWWDIKLTYSDGRGQSTLPAKLGVLAPITNR